MTDDDSEDKANQPARTSSGRFVPGASGNPSGRPRGARNFKTLLAEELRSPVKIQEGGKTRTISKQQALVKQLVGKGLKGDDRAMSKLIPLMLEIGTAELAEAGKALTDEQKEILKRNARRLLQSLDERD